MTTRQSVAQKRIEWTCAACGRSKEQVYGGPGGLPCRGNYCREQGIDPTEPKHGASRVKLLTYGLGLAKHLGGKEWRVRVRYNLHWYLVLWQEGGLELWPPSANGGMSGEGEWTADFHNDRSAQVWAKGPSAEAALRAARSQLLLRIAVDVESLQELYRMTGADE